MGLSIFSSESTPPKGSRGLDSSLNLPSINNVLSSNNALKPPTAGLSSTGGTSCCSEINKEGPKKKLSNE